MQNPGDMIVNCSNPNKRKLRMAKSIDSIIIIVIVNHCIFLSERSLLKYLVYSHCILIFSSLFITMSPTPLHDEHDAFYLSHD